MQKLINASKFKSLQIKLADSNNKYKDDSVNWIEWRTGEQAERDVSFQNILKTDL